jgi:hypothetical protein
MSRRQFAYVRLSWAVATETRLRRWQVSIRLRQGFGEMSPAEANVLFHDLDVVQRTEVAVVHFRRNLIADLYLVVDVRFVG